MTVESGDAIAADNRAARWIDVGERVEVAVVARDAGAERDGPGYRLGVALAPRSAFRAEAPRETWAVSGVAPEDVAAWIDGRLAAGRLGVVVVVDAPASREAWGAWRESLDRWRRWGGGVLWVVDEPRDADAAGATWRAADEGGELRPRWVGGDALGWGDDLATSVARSSVPGWASWDRETAWLRAGTADDAVFAWDRTTAERPGAAGFWGVPLLDVRAGGGMACRPLPAAQRARNRGAFGRSAGRTR
jgi:hypothetical protein